MPIRPDAEELYININGQKLGGWTEVHVVRGVERLPSAFYIRTTDKAPGQFSQLNPSPGSPCQIYLSGDLALTGYLDVFDVRLAAGQHEILLSGRSKCEDLVDSSIDGNEIGGWNQTFMTIGEAAKKLAQPYKIQVTGDGMDTPIPEPNIFTIDPGNTGAQLLEGIARTTGSLVWDDPQGRLVISNVGTGHSRGSLVEGVNVEVAHAVRRMDLRFSDYFVYGMQQLTGQGYVPSFAHVKDDGVPRHRVRIIPWEAPDQHQYQERRALWEAARRMGRSNTITIQTTGWRDSQDKIWEPNSLIGVEVPTCKVKGQLVISEVTWERGPATGTTCSLVCMPKGGLQPQPLERELPVAGTQEPAAR